MNTHINPFFSDGRWGFQENWPRRTEAPVFDILYGDVHVARLFKEERWKITFRAGVQIGSDLGSLMDVLAMIADRMAQSDPALEADGAALRRMARVLGGSGNPSGSVRWGGHDGEGG